MGDRTQNCKQSPCDSTDPEEKWAARCLRGLEPEGFVSGIELYNATVAKSTQLHETLSLALPFTENLADRIRPSRNRHWSPDRSQQLRTAPATSPS
jgi:hypothetical protein